MPEHADPTKITTELAGAAGTAADFAEQASHVAHAGEGPGMGQILAPFALANGIHEMMYGESGTDQMLGYFETVSGAGGTLDLLGTVTGIAPEAGLFVGEAGAVVGAGVAGYEVGQYGNETAAKNGWLGKGEDGKARDWSDWWGDKVFPGGSEWSPDNVTNAGPLLVAAGLGAGASAYAGSILSPFDDLFGGDEEPAATAQEVAQFHNDTDEIYNQMLRAGQSRDVAEMMARNVDPGFHAPRGGGR